jgi:hypothetical protein
LFDTLEEVFSTILPLKDFESMLGKKEKEENRRQMSQRFTGITSIFSSRPVHGLPIQPNQ